MAKGKTLDFSDIPHTERKQITEANANCWHPKNAPTKVECTPRDSFLEVEQDEYTPPEKPFLDQYGGYFLGVGAIIAILYVIGWIFNRPAPVRNNILIGGATIGAFCLNPIAGAIVLAAWIFKR